MLNWHNIISLSKYKHTFIAVALICFCLISAFAARSLHQSYVLVNSSVIPELTELQIKQISNVQDLKSDQFGLYKYYENLISLETDLNVDLLSNTYALDNSYAIYQYRTDQRNWHQIKVTAYIVGDAKIIERVDGEDEYLYESGTQFISPIDLEIDIISSQAQYDVGLEKEYLGEYQFIESYQCSNGFIVNLLQSNASASTPRLTAIFVSDGIRYTLSGNVSIETMKQIILAET